MLICVFERRTVFAKVLISKKIVLRVRVSIELVGSELMLGVELGLESVFTAAYRYDRSIGQ